MKAFDFDNTLYHGESSLDFALFMIKKNKKIILWLPRIFINFLTYKLCLIKTEQIVSLINAFMKSVIKKDYDVEALVDEFWKENKQKLNKNLVKKISKDDVIITAGPSFLINGIKKRLGTSNLICSVFDIDKRCVEYLNFGENKVKEYRKRYGDEKVDIFYTDSYNDKAMMEISKNVFLVGKNGIKRIK